MPCFEKSNPVHNESMRRAWSLYHEWCMACGGPEGRGPKWVLHTHHILGGKHGRSDEPCNFLRLHGQCHDLCHDAVIRTKTGPIERLTLGMQLTLKRERDPESWNLERLRELRRPWSLPDLEPLPTWCVEQWAVSRQARMLLGWREIAPADVCEVVSLSLPVALQLKAKAIARKTNQELEQVLLAALRLGMEKQSA